MLNNFDIDRSMKNRLIMKDLIKFKPTDFTPHDRMLMQREKRELELIRRDIKRSEEEMRRYRAPDLKTMTTSQN